MRTAVVWTFFGLSGLLLAAMPLLYHAMLEALRRAQGCGEWFCISTTAAVLMWAIQIDWILSFGCTITTLVLLGRVARKTHGNRLRAVVRTLTASVILQAMASSIAFMDPFFDTQQMENLAWRVTTWLFFAACAVFLAAFIVFCLTQTTRGEKVRFRPRPT